MKGALKYEWEGDPLICNLMESKGKRVEIIAFGVVYTGKLKKVDLENGFVVVADEENQVALEIERIESFCVLP